MPAQALSFLVSAERNAERVVAQDSRFLPTGPFANGTLPGLTAEGPVEQIVWTVGDGTLSSMQLLAPLRDQLIAEGYLPIYECETDVCGGYDFRYGIDLFPEPDMHVNLGDFRYFAARRGAAEAEYVYLVVSRSAQRGFVHLTRIGGSAAAANFIASTKTPAPDAPVIGGQQGPIATLLETEGHAILGDLAFLSGSSELGEGSFGSLDDLAAYLGANPDRTIMLVGHTDAEGSLTANVTLSRRRATAVMERLISDFGVSPDQVAADGVGFLAPRASNLTPDGRTQNRRVEVILTSTQ